MNAFWWKWNIKMLPHVRPGSIVYSDEWSSYQSLNTATGLVHNTVNHSLYFVDPTTGAHTQGVEGMWSCCRGRKRQCTPSYSRLTYLNLCGGNALGALLHFLTYWSTSLNNTLYRFRGLVLIDACF